MSQQSDLVSLAQVKAWASVTSSNDDALLGTLITSISRSILTYLQRPAILPTAFSETLNGTGHDHIVLLNWPVISVSSLSIGGSLVPASPALSPGVPYQYGYVVEPAVPFPPGRPQALYLRGYAWRNWLVQGCDIQSVVVSYSAGYQVNSEAQTVPGTPPYQITALGPYGAWAVDGGVAYASGGILNLVASAPASGQYSVSNGVYTFAAADASAPVLLTYGYVPADLAGAAMEWVAERYSYHSRIGLKSKSLGGQETISYECGPIPDFVKQAINPYRRVALF